MNCAACPIRDAAECHALHQQDPATFAVLARGRATAPAASLILRAGESASRMFTLYEGWAFRFTLMSDGRRQILGFLLPGDMISLRGLFRQMTFSVQALSDVKLCAFDADDFRDAMKNSPLRERLVQRLILDAAAADAQIAVLGRRTAVQRIAHMFLDLACRLRDRGLAGGDDGDMALPLRQKHIGDVLGLSGVHVSRTLALLRDRGAIAFGRSGIVLNDRATLRGLAGEVL